MSKQKLLIKVIDEETSTWKWVHLCHIDNRVYAAFKAIPRYESLTIGSHINRWLQQDFGVKLSMSQREDIRMLKNILKTWYHREYPELYLKCPGDKQRIANLVGIWITQHMEYEIEFSKGGKKHG